MEIVPHTVSGSWTLGGNYLLDCGTWSVSFYFWAWILVEKGSVRQSLVLGVFCGDPEEDLWCTWQDTQYYLWLESQAFLVYCCKIPNLPTCNFRDFCWRENKPVFSVLLCSTSVEQSVSIIRQQNLFILVQIQNIFLRGSAIVFWISQIKKLPTTNCTV